MTHLRQTLALMAVLAVALPLACTEAPTDPGLDIEAEFAKGNGFPDGPHDYKMQIIGVPKDKTAKMDGNNGHRIFVRLNGGQTANPGKNNDGLKKGGNNDQNQIYLCNSTDGLNDVDDARCDAWRANNPGEFGVVDANGTDGDGAMFALPDPCPDDNTATTDCTPVYGIWVRALTSGSVTITTCADETGDGFDGEDDVWCGENGITITKRSDRKAIEVSDYLLAMVVDIDGVANPELAGCLGIPTDATTDNLEVNLFDDCFENYFWNYDNKGLKNLDMRFYSV